MLARLILALALSLSTLAHADLTPAQRATLAADIQADPALSQLPPSSDAANQIIAAYAAPAAPAHVVWRSSLTTELTRAAIVSGATQMDALTVGKRDTLLYLCGQTLNAADPAVRAAIDDLTGSQATLKAALVAAQKRNANRLEALFASGAGTTASPSTATLEGGLSYQDVLATMGW